MIGTPIQLLVVLFSVISFIGMLFPLLATALTIPAGIVFLAYVAKIAKPKEQPFWRKLTWVFVVPFCFSLVMAETGLFPIGVVFFVAFVCPVIAFISYIKAYPPIKPNRQSKRT